MFVLYSITNRCTLHPDRAVWKLYTMAAPICYKTRHTLCRIIAVKSRSGVCCYSPIWICFHNAPAMAKLQSLLLCLGLIYYCKLSSAAAVDDHSVQDMEVGPGVYRFSECRLWNAIWPVRYFIMHGYKVVWYIYFIIAFFIYCSSSLFPEMSVKHHPSTT